MNSLLQKGKGELGGKSELEWCEVRRRCIEGELCNTSTYGYVWKEEKRATFPAWDVEDNPVPNRRKVTNFAEDQKHVTGCLPLPGL